MAVDKKSVHVRLSPEVHGKLQVLADAEVKDVAELAGVFLEKAVVGEFHAFSIALDRLNRLGLVGNKR